MRHQWRHVQPSVRQQVQHRLEVALLGPAHEADGVVQALRFVTRVIAPRAVGTGDLKAQLLVVEVRPRQFQAHDPDQDDAPALAAHLGGLMHRLIAAGGGGDNDRIHPAPAGEGPAHRHRVLTGGQVDGFGAKVARQGQLGRVEVDAQYPAALGAQQLHRQQANQPQTGDHHRLAQGGGDQADALQGDGADDSEGRGLVRHPVGDARAEVDRHCHHLGVLAVGDDPVADGKARFTPLPPRGGGVGGEGGGGRRPTGIHRLTIATDPRHHPDLAIAQGQGLLQLVAHRGQGRRQAVGPDLVQYLAHLVRLLAGLLQGIGLAEVDQHAFGAGGDQGAGGA